jgi:hypothetical protein
MIQTGNLISIRAVLAWGCLNLTLLGIGAAGLPLWAHHPFPRESLTIEVLMCGQTLLASMLFPLLARTRWTLAINLAFLLPIDELGGLLSNWDQFPILKCGLCVGAWMFGLGMWRFVVKSEETRLAIIAAATCFTAGGAVLDYLRWEVSASNNQSASFMPFSLLPAMCVLHFNPITWVEAMLPMMLATMVWVARRCFAKTSSTSLHNMPR